MFQMSFNLNLLFLGFLGQSRSKVKLYSSFNSFAASCQVFFQEFLLFVSIYFTFFVRDEETHPRV